MQRPRADEQSATREKLADGLRLAIARLARRLRQQSLGGLTMSQRSVLASLYTHGPLPIGRIAEIETVSRPSISGIVRRMAEQGLVHRTTDPADGRSVIVGLTAAGAEVIERGRQERTAFLAAALTELGDEEVAVLAAAAPILERMATFASTGHTPDGVS